MRQSDLFLGLIVAGAAYIIWKKYSKPTTRAQQEAAFRNAGANVLQSRLHPNSTVIQAGDTVFDFAPGDFDKLNFAQKFLIGLDRIVPGTALTRAVLK